MSLSPLIIFIVMSFAYASLYISSIRKSLNIESKFCIESTTSIQRKHRKSINKLLKLNTKAAYLRLKRKSAEIALKTAPPPAKPAALAHLNRVKMQQKIFRYKQNIILKEAKMQSAKFFAKMKFKRFRLNRKNPKLQMLRYPLLSESPSYKLKPNFVNRKKIRAHKKISSVSLTPLVVQKFLKVQNSTIKVECGTTLTKIGGAPSKIKLLEAKL